MVYVRNRESNELRAIIGKAPNGTLYAKQIYGEKDIPPDQREAWEFVPRKFIAKEGRRLILSLDYKPSQKCTALFLSGKPRCK